MIAETYIRTLSHGGKLKLRATALRAEGQDFEAAVLFHEAARIERHALRALQEPPPETRLAACIEECGCLLDGFDPIGAAFVRGQILEQCSEIDRDLAGTMLSRLESRFATELSTFQQQLSTRRALYRAAAMGTITPPPPLRRELRKEVGALLRLYPGIASFWWAAYRNAEVAGELQEAWDALGKAHRLEPERAAFVAMRVNLAARVLSPTQAGDFLAAVFPLIRRGEAADVVCLQFALAQVALASDDQAQLGRARTAALQGLARCASSEIGKYLKAALLLIDEKVAGRSATIDVLYRAGLGALVLLAGPKQHADPIRMLHDGAKAATEHSVHDLELAA